MIQRVSKCIITALSFVTAGMFYILPVTGQAQQPNYTGPVNYVRTWDALKPESNANNITMAAAVKDHRMTTQYMDGLGRPVQTVVKQGSLKTGVGAVDLISTNVYDEFGRERYGYLPFGANAAASNTSVADGLFKTTVSQQQIAFYGNTYGSSPIPDQGETYYYGQMDFEASPLNRVTETFAPGNSWVGTAGESVEANRHSVKVKYYTNTANDLVRIWNITNAVTVGEWGTITTPGGDTGYYPAGTLYKTITLDEHNKQSIEFKDKSGQVILKKVQLTAAADNGSGAGYAGWICTYYIYDDLGNLRTVIQPNSVNGIYTTWVIPENNLAEVCFKYEYDERNRMIRKHVPGANDMYYVYDARDRLIMFRDGNMTHDGKWLVTKYDPLNRPVETGIWINNGSPASHRAGASASTNYPSTPSNYDLLSTTHYDNYDDLPAGLSASLDNNWSAEFIASYNTAPLYAQPLVRTDQLLGRVAWVKSKVLGSPSSYVYTVNLYDDKGRVIQSKSTNITGGQDVITTQYSWSGQPLITVSYSNIGGTPVQHITQVTRMEYDSLARLVKVEKKMVNGIAPGGSLSGIAFTTLAEHTYDAVGNLKDKTIGSRKDPSTGQYYGSRQPLDTLRYDYNIRGWQLGMNRIMAKGGNTDNYFGYDIGYNEWRIRLPGQPQIGGYAYPAFNGNIGGITWKSIGDGEIRKYDYAYDQTNRLLKADFSQYSSGTSWSNASIDFSVKMGDGITGSTAYDNNGNIRRMRQWGLTLTGSRLIDSLSYNYYGNTLKSVTEMSPAIGATDFHLGDFTDRNRTGDDYGYDRSGNLITDKNKHIIGNVGSYQGTSGPIRHNHLNLPSQITVHKDSTGTTVKGTIEYLYTAEGVKLEKKVRETGVAVSGDTTTVTTTTRYLNGLVLESKSYSNATLNTTLGYADRLLFGAQEEGRVRAVYDSVNPSVFNRFEYDYMLKDHLGNVRMVLTEELKTDAYPAATMEDVADKNNLNDPANYIPFYGNTDYTENSSYRYAVSGLSSYPGASTGNDYVARLQGNAQKIGPSMILKVMAGDKFHIQATSWWESATPSGTTSPLPSIVSGLISGVPGVSGGKISATELTSTVLDPQVTEFLLDQPYNTSRPKAYLNWVLFDEQFRYVESGSGAEQVGESGVLTPHVRSNLPVDKNGYLYIYVSNETNNIAVIFDNLQVTHVRGAILEETHYYPFGLTMAGISSKALEFGNPENKYKYNGIEKEDDLGLEVYDAELRELDGQIGRWWQIDPVTEGYEDISPYASNYNNPIRYSDPLGDEGEDCCQWLLDAGEKLLISASGLVNGAVNTLTFGLVSSDPFNFRNRLSDENKMWYDNAVTVGKYGPLVAPVFGKSPSPPPQTPMVQPVEGSPVPVTTPVTVPVTPPVVLPMSNSQEKTQTSNEKLIEEAKKQKAKEQKAQERLQNRQTASLNGKNKQGNSNQEVRGDHTSTKGGRGKAKKGDHENANARRAREQKASAQKKKKK